MAQDEVAQRLEVELHCPECGAAIAVGVWDQSATCAFCASLLVCGRLLGEEVFVVANATSGTLDAVELLIRCETESYRNTLIGEARSQEGLSLDLPALIDARVAVFRARLEAQLERVETIDFLVPYELHERTIAQAVLGRRGAAKESFVRCFRTEDLRRCYDATRLNLRDRGLKIRGSRLALLSETERDQVRGRHLERVGEATGRSAKLLDRSGLRVDEQTQVISQFDGVVAERNRRIWKHMSVARVRRSGVIESHLVDRQFDTIAGKLSTAESDVFRALQERPFVEMVGKTELRAIASECPNCGAHLELPARARIAFCATCALGVRITPERLEPHAYSLADLPAAPGAEAIVFFPFWALPFRLRAGGREFTRIWDWLEAASEQAAAAEFRENDPAQSQLFVPARAIFGTRELDDAFTALMATATWRQPSVRVERAQPVAGARLLDVELEADEATALARYALVALHDAQSTRSLTGLVFRELVAKADLSPGEPSLVLLPLPLHAGHWVPSPVDAPGEPARTSPGMRPVPRELLEDDGRISRLARAFSLP